MNSKEVIKDIINEIVKKSKVAIKGIINEEIKIDFVDIFPKYPEERNILLTSIRKIGKQIFEKDTGEVFQLNKNIKTEFGGEDIIKIRIYDKNKLQRGAPDFLVKDYSNFKKRHLKKKGFSLIERATYEMIELNIPGSDVLIYFPNRPISEDFLFNKS